MKSPIYFLAPLLSSIVAPAAPFQLPADKEAAVESLLSRMTREEKLSLVSGPASDTILQFDTRKIDRVGIPAISMADGPVGISLNGSRMQPATLFPTPVVLAATWDPGLVEEIGRAIAAEALAFNRTMLLAPIVEVVRLPHNGRNFEMFSEDPFYNSRLSVAYIRGVQSRQVAAVAKHIICSGQEMWRGTADVEADERTLREIYFPPYEAAVREAGVVGVMGAYNKFRGLWCCEQPYLLNDILKGEWGFQGVVVSDWGAVHSPAAAMAGTDLEMPFAGQFGQPLADLLDSGKFTQERLDDMCRRILRAIAFVGLLDGPRTGDPADISSPAHLALARRGATEGIVLLKNAPAGPGKPAVLPLDLKNRPTVAVLGPRAGDLAINGGGCAEVNPSRRITPIMALREAFGDKAKILAPAWHGSPTYGAIPAAWLRTPEGQPPEQGLRGEYFANANLEGEPAVVRTDATTSFDWGANPPAPGLGTSGYSIRWTGRIVPDKSGPFFLRVTSPDTARVFVDGKLFLEAGQAGRIWPTEAFGELPLQAGKPVDLRIELRKGEGMSLFDLGLVDIGSQVEAAKAADVAIVFAGYTDRIEREIQDRESLELPPDQVALIRAVSAANPRTVVVLNTGGPVLVRDWIDAVPALVCAWYPGQEGFPALADLLTGKENFSGKSPVTWPKRWKDHPVTYPTPDGPVTYTEGLLVGYRHFDAKGIAPEFPFGHGLSYTSFELSRLKAEPGPDGTAHVTCTVRNSGKRAGAAIVQIYVGQDSPALPRPPRELKAFQRVPLEPGASSDLSFDLPARAFQYWSPAKGSWTRDDGAVFHVGAGFSSREIPLSVSLK